LNKKKFIDYNYILIFLDQFNAISIFLFNPLGTNLKEQDLENSEDAMLSGIINLVR